MALPQISTVSIPCCVIQFNNNQFIVDGKVEGRVMWIPVRGISYEEINYWCTPVKDSGVFDTLEFYIQEGENVTQPTFDSFSTFRVRDKKSGDNWWVYGTFQDFMASAETCCGDDPVLMPGINDEGDVSFFELVAPCSIICSRNADDELYSIFGLPTLSVGEKYYPYGSYENVPFATASGAGYSSVSDLLTFLNTNWNTSSGGSPAASLVWTASDDELTLFATGGNEGDSICVAVKAFTTSP